MSNRTTRLIDEACTKIHITYKSDMPDIHKYRMAWNIVDDTAYRIHNPQDEVTFTTPPPSGEDDTFYSLAQYLKLRGIEGINTFRAGAKIAAYYRNTTGNPTRIMPVADKHGHRNPTRIMPVADKHGHRNPTCVYAMNELHILDDFFRVNYPREWKKAVK